MHSLSQYIAGLEASDSRQLATLAFYLMQLCIARSDWGEAYLILFYLHQRKVRLSSCQILSQQEIATMVAAILTKTSHIEDMQSVLELAEYFDIALEPSAAQVEDKLKALVFLSEVLLNAVRSGQLVPSIRDVIMQCAINVFNHLIERHPKGRFLYSIDSFFTLFMLFFHNFCDHI
jgi:hypothetical protein